MEQLTKSHWLQEKHAASRGFIATAWHTDKCMIVKN